MIWKWSGLMFINFLTNGTLCVKDNLIPVRYGTLYVKGGLVLLGLIEYGSYNNNRVYYHLASDSQTKDTF